MAERPLTERQERALLSVAQGRASSYSRKSCASLVQRGLLRDNGPRRLVRYTVTDAGRVRADEILQAILVKLRAGTL